MDNRERAALERQIQQLQLANSWLRTQVAQLQEALWTAKEAPAKKKANARSYANTYLRRGKLTREPCEACGALDVVMHHDDYDKPLQVRWLCRTHHAEHHAAERTSRRTSLAWFPEVPRETPERGHNAQNLPHHGAPSAYDQTHARRIPHHPRPQRRPTRPP